jgi:hypothetical protein
MRTTRFTGEHMVAIIRETDRDTVAAKRHGVSEQTIYGWKKVLSAPCHLTASRRRCPRGSRPALSFLPRLVRRRFDDCDERVVHVHIVSPARIAPDVVA